MQLVQSSSVESLGEQVVQAVKALVREKPKAVIGWPSGRSTLPVLEAVYRQSDMDLSGVTIVMMDEYAYQVEDNFFDCDPSAHYSCHRWVKEHWETTLSRSARPEVLIPSANDPALYEQIIEERGGMDLFLIAIGASDGHVAFNPPGTPSESRTRVLQIARSTRMDNLGTFPEFSDLEDVPSHGTSVGLGTILSSRQIIALAHGSQKANIVRRTLSAGKFIADLPSTCIYLSNNCQFYVSELGEDIR